MKAIYFLILPTILSGCAYSQLGGGNRGYDRNSPEGIECTYEATKGAAAVQATGRSGINFDQMYKEEELFNLCMASKRANNPKQNNSIADEVKKVQSKIITLCSNPEFKDYYAKTSCFSNEITFEQMADKNKISENEKLSMLKARKEADLANNEILTIYKNSGQRNYEKFAQLLEFSIFPQYDNNNLDLYSGKITWGECNKIRKDISINAANASKNIK